MVTVHVEGSGVLAGTVRQRVSAHPDLTITDAGPSRAEVVIAAGSRSPGAAAVPTILPSLRQPAAGAGGGLRVAGFWGGLGSLLAAVAVDETAAPRELHVAYGFPGARRLLRRASPGVRRDLVGLATDDAVARIEGELVPERLGEGRRLAWFPQPVGPAHAVAVGGLEHLAPLRVPTVRTWVAARSMTAELLQAVGRLDLQQGVGAWLARRAAVGGGDVGATADVRWAVVVECLDEDGTVVRAWANGTDPVAAAADLLLVAARRVAEVGVPADGTVVGLGDVRGQLDAAADVRALRWSVSRPEPSPR